MDSSVCEMFSLALIFDFAAYLNS